MKKEQKKEKVESLGRYSSIRQIVNRESVYFITLLPGFCTINRLVGTYRIDGNIYEYIGTHRYVNYFTKIEMWS